MNDRIFWYAGICPLRLRAEDLAAVRECFAAGLDAATTAQLLEREKIGDLSYTTALTQAVLQEMP